LQLAHPTRLRHVRRRRCRIENRDRPLPAWIGRRRPFPILPQRALKPAEARDMLEPGSTLLSYRHGPSLVQSRSKPANRRATADQRNFPRHALSHGESRQFHPSRSSRRRKHMRRPLYPCDRRVPWHDLSETLTQPAPPALPVRKQADPLIPDTSPQPLRDVARHRGRAIPVAR